MVVYEDYCVDCPSEKGCMGLACPNRNVPIYYCDECKEEIHGKIYYDEYGNELCLTCYKAQKGEEQ